MIVAIKSFSRQCLITPASSLRSRLCSSHIVTEYSPIRTQIPRNSDVCCVLSTQARFHPGPIKRRKGANFIKIANKLKVNTTVALSYTLKTRLAGVSPKIAEEWDYERNPGRIYPKILGCGDITPYWWRCGDCGSHFKMSVERRILQKEGCAKCKRIRLNQQSEPQMGNREESLEKEERLHSNKERSIFESTEDELLEGERQSSKPINVRSRQPIGKF